jgi:hypothetical protein
VFQGKQTLSEQAAYFVYPFLGSVADSGIKNNNWLIFVKFGMNVMKCLF